MTNVECIQNFQTIEIAQYLLKNLQGKLHLSKSTGIDKKQH